MGAELRCLIQGKRCLWTTNCSSWANTGREFYEFEIVNTTSVRAKRALRLMLYTRVVLLFGVVSHE